jgi:CHAT domain-containing protein
VTRLCLLFLVVFLAAAGPDRLAEGERAWRAGDSVGALMAWSQALARAHSDSERFEALLWLSTGYRELGRQASARQALDQAAALETGRPLDGPRLGNARGLWLLSEGDPVAAEAAFAQALDRSKALEDPALAANVANNQALARMARGDLQGAVERFADAGLLYRELGDPEGLCDAWINLGVALNRMGRWHQARDVLEGALAQARSRGDLGREIDASIDLALVLAELSAVDQARALLVGALGLAQARSDLDRQGRILVNLAALDQEAGRSESALARTTAAQQAFAGAGRPRAAAAAALDRTMLQGGGATALRRHAQLAQESGDGPLEARARLNLAVTDPSDAAEQAALALALAEHWGQASIAWQARALVGQLALARGDTAQGLAELERVVRDLERQRGPLRDGAERDFLVQHEGVYQALLQARLDQGDTLGALAFAASLQLQELPVAPPQPLAILASQEDWLSGQLQRAQGLPEQEEALRRHLTEVRVKFAETVDALRDSNPEWAASVRIDPRDLEAIQRRLDPGVVVLQPVSMADRLVVLAFSNQDLIAVEVPGADQATLTQSVDRLARMLRLGMALKEPEVLAAADQLGAWLIDPVASILDSAETIVVSVAGPLRQLPFAMLRHQGRFLVQDHAVVRVTHVGSLVGIGASPRFQLAGRDLLVLGDPDGTLPSARREALAIAERFPGSAALLGEEVSRFALENNLAGRRALHLATHSWIDPTHPRRSGIQLGGKDTLLHGEIPGLAPSLASLRLVVLSSCESNLPAEGLDGTSIDGLAAQFRRAGVESLLASLWTVSDDSTHALMLAFYSELAGGHDLARSLQQAQLRLLEDRATAHPYYWAPFVLIGDWR